MRILRNAGCNHLLSVVYLRNQRKRRGAKKSDPVPLSPKRSVSTRRRGAARRGDCAREITARKSQLIYIGVIRLLVFSTSLREDLKRRKRLHLIVVSYCIPSPSCDTQSVRRGEARRRRGELVYLRVKIDRVSYRTVSSGKRGNASGTETEK